MTLCECFILPSSSEAVSTLPAFMHNFSVVGMCLTFDNRMALAFVGGKFKWTSTTSRYGQDLILLFRFIHYFFVFDIPLPTYYVSTI